MDTPLSARVHEATVAGPDAAFKQQYNPIRAMRARKLNGMELGKIGYYERVGHEDPGAKHNLEMSVDIEGDHRQFWA
jgi:hypothetical protein